MRDRPTDLGPPAVRPLHHRPTDLGGGVRDLGWQLSKTPERQVRREARSASREDHAHRDREVDIAIRDPQPVRSLHARMRKYPPRHAPILTPGGCCGR